MAVEVTEKVEEAEESKERFESEVEEKAEEQEEIAKERKESKEAEISTTEVSEEEVKKLEEAIAEELFEERERAEVEEEEIKEETENEEPFSEALAIIEEVRKEKELSLPDVVAQISALGEAIDKIAQTVELLNEKLSKLLDQMNILAESMSEVKGLILMLTPRRPLAIEQPRKEKVGKELPSPEEVIKRVQKEAKEVRRPHIDIDHLLEEAESVIYSQEDSLVHAIKIEGLRITFEEILADVEKGKRKLPEEKVNAIKKILGFLKEESAILRPKILALT